MRGKEPNTLWKRQLLKFLINKENYIFHKVLSFGQVFKPGIEREKRAKKQLLSSLKKVLHKALFPVGTFELMSSSRALRDLELLKSNNIERKKLKFKQNLNLKLKLNKTKQKKKNKKRIKLQLKNQDKKIQINNKKIINRLKLNTNLLMNIFNIFENSNLNNAFFKKQKQYGDTQFYLILIQYLNCEKLECRLFKLNQYISVCILVKIN
ncbi:hypothetical protein TTHERM_00338520 (macronuclear) [Tetrahymena thermophila SB210]|uniref:Uncharacterized protein n=1 Tax=Tetrahymena thermophila (strain SB210) TaxID=312017 RepID=I7LV77_TETTS|nr:hypothetical protein TTHERM_00338520 [Tetrahymena thermophila SB210]EAR97370.2 hypothetical protein TTHERM_00338520 [Tetrahymena thermophila SB210]|eukprot:XP_001017615.2 hypothetical protein TTHERM_00338520 [Tetrahymena thermophila SB210]